MKLIVLVAAHKAYCMPDDPVYRPIQVGAAGKPPLNERWLRDDTGDSISVKNPHYCELTALYWAWKNLDVSDADCIGLTHYRRYFASRCIGGKRGRIATGAQISDKLRHADALLPRKRRYFIETNYSQYAHAHHELDLIKTKEILAELYPDYIKPWDSVMARTSGHRFNMLVFSRALLDAYCGWLFSILFELEARLDISSYSRSDARVFGYISERLLDIWLEKNGVQYAELPVVNLENQHWGRKVINFIKRKVSPNTH